MTDDETLGRTAALGQILEVWCGFGTAPSWVALREQLGGLGESLCLIRWTGDADSPVIVRAGAQAVLACGRPLQDASINVLSGGLGDAAREAEQARAHQLPFTAEAEAELDGATPRRRIARLYLPLIDAPSAVACAVIRIS